MRQCILVDNLYSSGYTNLSNTVPILGFFGDLNDNELSSLGDYLYQICNVPDYRVLNELNFNFQVLKDAKGITEACRGYLKIFGALN